MQHPRRTAARFLVAILLLSTLSPAAVFADTAFSLHAVRYNLTYVAGQLASFFSDLADAIASHIPIISLTASAAAPAPAPSPATALGFLATTTPEASTPPTTPTASDAPQTTIIQHPVIEQIVERTVPAPAASGISEQTLASRLASLKDDLLLRIAAVASAPIAFSGPAPSTPISTASFAPSQRIDSLTNTAINTPTITGGSISGASISGYLPISGGTLSGTLSGTDLTLSGALTAGALNVTSIASAGALTGPYFTATSTTATSSFAGGITGPGNFTIQQGSGNVGIGTTTPQSLLHLYGGASGGTTGSGAFTIEDDTAVFLQLMMPAGNQEQIRFGDADNSGAGLILYHHTDDRMAFYTAGAERLRITSAGNIGINDTTPSYSLDVNGFINTDGTTGGYKQAGNTVLYASTTNTSLAVGASAAAAWMSASSTSWLSVAIGQGALGTTPTSGTAIANTAVGYNALSSNTIGQINTALGYFALWANTTAPITPQVAIVRSRATPLAVSTLLWVRERSSSTLPAVPILPVAIMLSFPT